MLEKNPNQFLWVPIEHSYFMHMLSLIFIPDTLPAQLLHTHYVSVPMLLSLSLFKLIS